MMPAFDKQWNNMGLSDLELRKLQEQLILNPAAGNVIPETGGLRKIRFAFDGQGKSSSIRVVYVDFTFYEKIYLIYAYPKSEKDNLTKEERNNIKKMIERNALLGGDKMNVYKGIMKGLQEAVDYTDGKITARKNMVMVTPIGNFKAEDIKKIRNDTQMTQAIFAQFLGVSNKTVEAWEAGRNEPEGPARRILSMLQADPHLPERLNIIKR